MFGLVRIHFVILNYSIKRTGRRALAGDVKVDKDTLKLRFSLRHCIPPGNVIYPYLIVLHCEIWRGGVGRGMCGTA